MMGGGEDKLPVRLQGINPIDTLPPLQVEGTIATAITIYPPPDRTSPGLGKLEMFRTLDPFDVGLGVGKTHPSANACSGPT